MNSTQLTLLAPPQPAGLASLRSIRGRIRSSENQDDEQLTIHFTRNEDQRTLKLDYSATHIRVFTLTNVSLMTHFTHSD